MRGRPEDGERRERGLKVKAGGKRNVPQFELRPLSRPLIPHTHTHISVGVGGNFGAQGKFTMAGSLYLQVIAFLSPSQNCQNSVPQEVESRRNTKELQTSSEVPPHMLSWKPSYECRFRMVGYYCKPGVPGHSRLCLVVECTELPLLFLQ